MFKKGVRYRHSCAKDLDILVMDVFDQGDVWHLNIFYVFQRTGQYAGNEYVNIKKADEQFWSVVVKDKE